jgi:cyclopropane-fatty-acyl-phospholipid synthase
MHIKINKFDFYIINKMLTLIYSSLLILVLYYLYNISIKKYSIYKILKKNKILNDHKFKIKNNDKYNLFKKWEKYGSLGIGETYINSEWSYEGDLEEFIEKLYNIPYEDKIIIYKNIRTIIWYFITKIFNNQTIKKTKDEISIHYNTSNKIFELMLDQNMQYSCGFWNTAKTLNEAQNEKFSLICRKLKMYTKENKSFEILDIGCGWGGFADYLTNNYNVKVTCITISDEQYKYICNKYANKIKLKIINIILCDYREIINYTNKKFDRIISIEMMEHVGYKNYINYFKIISQLLKEDGLILLQTGVINKPLTKLPDEFMDKYIFPNAMLPSNSQILKSVEKNKLILHDCNNFGKYYYKTLNEWKSNFLTKVVNNINLSEKEKRIWIYYLTISAVAFKNNQVHLYQLVLSNHKYTEVYEFNN